MNKKQLTEFGRHQFLLLELAADVDAAVSPMLIEAMQSIQAIVETLPAPGNLMREREWQRVRPFVERALAPYTDAFGDALVKTMIDAAPAMQQHAVEMSERAGLQMVQVGNLPAATASAISSAKIGDQVLTDLLGVGRATSPLTIQNVNKVNKHVIRGILEDVPTPEIAKDIVQVINRAGSTYVNTRGFTVTRNIRSTAETIARTAIQDVNHQITQATWEANQEAIDEAGFEYEWVAALDSRVCPTCAPLDGLVEKTEAKLISRAGGSVPIHPNCRCDIVLRDPEDEDFNDAPRTGQQLYDEKQPGGYKTKIEGQSRNSDGKARKFYRKAEEVTSGTRYADYIADSNDLTQREFFGGGPKYVTRNGKQEFSSAESRATWFRSEVSKGKDPQTVLAQMTSGKGGASRFLSPANLPR